MRRRTSQPCMPCESKPQTVNTASKTFRVSRGDGQQELVEANKIAVRVEQGLRETVTALRKRWKPTDIIVTTPWNAPEFDKYVNRS